MTLFAATTALLFAAAGAHLPTRSLRGLSGDVLLPMVGIGTWQYNSTVAEAAVSTAFGLGYRHADTAVVYKNHLGVGAALRKSGLSRDQYFVTSKVPGGLNASATRAALDQALVDLGLDHVDLMLVHWPAPDGKAAVQEQWLALERWAKLGKARAVGVSHHCKTQLDWVLEVATVPVALNQNQYHIGMALDMQPRLHDKAYCESKGVVYMSYSSLCGPCPAPDNMELVTGNLVTSIGKKYNKTGAQVSLRWLVQQGIPVIPKTGNPTHLQENFDLFDFELSGKDMKALSRAVTPAGTPQNPDDAQDCAFEQPGLHFVHV